MNPRFLIPFLVTATVTSFLWIAAWPSRETAPLPAPTTQPLPPPTWTPDRLSDDISQLSNANTPAGKLAAATRLAEIPIEEIPDALFILSSEPDRTLSLATKTLLARWASKDGRAAMDWAWLNFRSQHKWSPAFAEIGPNWAYHDPQGLAAWTKELLTANPTPQHVHQADYENHAIPPRSAVNLTKIIRWLSHSHPLAAFELLKSRGGFSTEDPATVKSLQTVAQVREALLAFPEYAPTGSTTISGDEIIPHALIARWQELDPEDFSRSPFADSSNLSGKSSILPAWEAASPEQRAETANTLVSRSDPQNRKNSILHIAREWAAKDPAAATGWLASLDHLDPVEKATLAASSVFPSGPSTVMPLISRIPEHSQPRVMMEAFDSWTRSNPVNPPDMTGWSPLQKKQWAGLSLLRGD